MRKKLAAPFFPSQITSDHFSAPVVFCLIKLNEPFLSSYYLWDQGACFDQNSFYQPLLILNTW